MPCLHASYAWLSTLLVLVLHCSEGSGALLRGHGTEKEALKVRRGGEDFSASSVDCDGSSRRKLSYSALQLSEALKDDRSLSVPGVGIDMSAIKPYATVYKDNFRYVTCAKDNMFHHGDLHGNGKDSYNIGENYNVSIVHYSEVVAKEDQKAMTHEVCFRFCRTLEHMHFFGIYGGRDCYCTPFFDVVGSDSAKCNSVCEGNRATLCGGRGKSAIFEMHMCNDMAKDLMVAMHAANTQRSSTSALASAAKILADDMTAAANKEQLMWGLAGDTDASALMQEAKVWAGQILKLANAAAKECDALMQSISKAQNIKNNDFLQSKNALLAENVIKDLERGKSRVEDADRVLQDIYDEATRGIGNADDRAQLYYPVMYFADKAYVDSPTTCSGDSDPKTIFKADFEECARACDGEYLPECVGSFCLRQDCVSCSPSSRKCNITQSAHSRSTTMCLRSCRISKIFAQSHR